MKKFYTVTDVDNRYQKVTQIGYIQFTNSFELTDEPFSMANVENWRYDKNIGQWVEGEIDEETGEWQLKTE